MTTNFLKPGTRVRIHNKLRMSAGDVGDDAEFAQFMQAVGKIGVVTEVEVDGDCDRERYVNVALGNGEVLWAISGAHLTPIIQAEVR